jgi:selenocysteine lyase/cysteine desulfurase
MCEMTPTTELKPSPRIVFEALRARDFARLDAAGHTYLDHTGATPYPVSLVRRQARFLELETLGNPHSENPTALRSTELMEQARIDVLRFFDADPAEYTLCFTANATAAIKLVAESFPFRKRSHFALPVDNHNSINGIRELARRRGAEVCYLPLDDELRLADPLGHLPHVTMGAPSLFAFPAQSNFSGVRHPLELVGAAQEMGYVVLLDAAAFVPTCALSLRAVHPDFVPISFYKMFGIPTGVGALIARREALAWLTRPWFAGGTVDAVSTVAEMHLLRPGAGAFEDGTPAFLSIPGVSDGLAFLEEVGMDVLNEHVADLTGAILDGLRGLRHPDGRPAVQIYGPDSLRDRGGTVSFNVLDPRGGTVWHDDVVAAAATCGISLRGGCFCNHGSIEAVFGHTAAATRRCLEATADDFTTSRFAACMGGLPVGAVRASVGLASHARDVDRLIDFLGELVRSRSSVQEGARPLVPGSLAAAR